MTTAVDLEQPASRLIITIQDSAGQLVHREELGARQAGLVEFDWNGQDGAGNRVASGEYRIEAEVYRGDAVSSGNTYTVVDVESVTLGVGGQDLTLSVSGLGDIGMDQVRKIL